MQGPRIGYAMRELRRRRWEDKSSDGPVGRGELADGHKTIAYEGRSINIQDITVILPCRCLNCRVLVDDELL